MARVTYVKKAQQRFKTVPVIDPATGEQKKVPVINGRTGEQKVSKRGPVFRRLTVDDPNQPLPNHKCDKCGKEICVGDPYKWIAPKSGPYGGSKRYRCGECPVWQVWEYSSSLSARISQIQASFEESFHVDDITTADEVTDALSSLAEEIRELASEKEEGADNIESGFGHSTSQSDEIREVADSLNGWADEIDQLDVPAEPEPEEGDCDDCSGTGKGDAKEGAVPIDVNCGIFAEEDLKDCEVCEGAGTTTPEEPTDDQYNEWRTEVEDAVSSVVDNCPV